MQISLIQQNKQVNFTSRVYIKNCSEIFKSKNVQNQIARLEKKTENPILYHLEVIPQIKMVQDVLI